MTRAIVISAVLTGVFCACFAIGVDYLTDMLDRQSIVVVSFVSGFLGSLFASLVMRKRQQE